MIIGKVFRTHEKLLYYSGIRELYLRLINTHNELFGFLFHDLTSSALKIEYNRLRPYKFYNFFDFPEWVKKNLKSNKNPDKLGTLLKHIMTEMEEFLWFLHLDDEAIAKLGSRMPTK